MSKTLGAAVASGLAVAGILTLGLERDGRLESPGRGPFTLSTAPRETVTSRGSPRKAAEVAKDPRPSADFRGSLRSRCASGLARGERVLEVERELSRRLGARVTAHGKPDCFHMDGAVPGAGSPEAVARAVLDEVLAVMAPGRTLVATRTLELSGNAVLVDFDQTALGLPVEDSTLKVELARTPGGLVPVRAWGPILESVNVENELSLAVERGLDERYPPLEVGRAHVSSPHRLVVARVGGRFLRAFEVLAHTAQGVSRDLVDAGTGELLESRAGACAGSATGLTYTRNPLETPRTQQALTGLTVNQGAASAVTARDGTFPLTGTVTLKGLAGPLLRVMPVKLDNPLAFMGAKWIYASELDLTYSGAADFTLAGAPPDETTFHQDEVATFWFASNYNAHVQQTYPLLQAGTQNRVLFQVHDGPSSGHFTLGPVTMDGEPFFGYVDLGSVTLPSGESRWLTRDGTVVRHEYTHGITASIAPNLPYQSLDGNSLNEFLADYLACVSYENPAWAAYSGPQYFRDLSGNPKLVYPQDEGAPSAPSGEPHRIGNIVGQALWEARMAAEARHPGDRLGVDQAVVESVPRYPPRVTLEQAREAIIAADLALNGGVNGYLIAQALHDHGIGGPPPAAPPAPGSLALYLATGGVPGVVAPRSYVTAQGKGLETAAGTTTVTVRDALGAVRAASCSYVSTTQVNFLVPDDTAPGVATVTVLGSSASLGTILVAKIAPGIFTADSSGSGLPAATYDRVRAGAIVEGTVLVSASPIALGGDQIILTLYGTGLRGGSTTTVTIGGESAQVQYAGAQDPSTGLDQVNVYVPSSMAGRGAVPVVVSVDGVAANTVTIFVQ